MLYDFTTFQRAADSVRAQLATAKEQPVLLQKPSRWRQFWRWLTRSR